MQETINYSERRNALMARRELSRQKRLRSMKKRLFVNIMGFKSFYEDV